LKQIEVAMNTLASAPGTLLPMADLAIASIHALNASLKSLSLLQASRDIKTLRRRGPRMKGPSGRRLIARVVSRRFHRKSRPGCCVACIAAKRKAASAALREREH